MSAEIHRSFPATWGNKWLFTFLIVLLVLAANPSRAQDTEGSIANPSAAAASHNHCLVPSTESSGSYLANRCSYRINAMYCHLRDTTPSGCEAQSISLSYGMKARVAPWPFRQFRWLACRNPAYPIESRWHDGTRIRVEWTCTA